MLILVGLKIRRWLFRTVFYIAIALTYTQLFLKKIT